MTTKSKLVAILLVATATVVCSNSNDDEFKETKLEKLHEDLKMMTDELWSNINDPRWYAALAFSAHRNIIPPDQHVLQAFARFGDQLEASGLDREMKILRQKLLSGAMGNLYVWASSDAQIGMIDALYEAFRRFQVRTAGTAITEATRRAFTDLAETILQDDPDSVPTSLSKLHDLMTIQEGGGVFGNTPRLLSENEGMNACDMQQSPKQLVYNIYNIASLTDLKGNAMMQFSWMLLSLYNIGNHTTEARAMEDRMKARIIEKKAALRRVLPQCSNEFWKCDPLNYAENVTYTKLTNLLQGHIQNEIDMSTEGNCREDCPYYSGQTFARVHRCYQGLFCAQQPSCNGRLFNCRFVDADSNVCLSSNTTERKYDWIEYKNGKVLGKKKACGRDPTTVNSWWRFVYHCSYCFCICDEQGPKSDRYFSLHSVIARGVDKDHTKTNRVVTGLRFVKVNRVIHLQIQDGVALPGGAINASTLEWRPIQPFKPNDPGVIRGVDFHMMTWEERSIDLDTLSGPEGNVLTGVRLRLLGPHLNLEILTTPFNITSGQLGSLNSSEWVGNDNTPAAVLKPRTEVVLIKPEVPTKCHRKSTVDSVKDQFVKFTHSDIDRDAAQTTVPYIDSQSVELNPPTLLIGAGIYHKGSINCGGFIAPKLVTYDFSQHLSP